MTVLETTHLLSADDLSVAPRCWIVPSMTVADAITESHAAWLGSPGQHGQERKDTDMRSLMFDYSHQGIGHRGAGWLDVYRDAWSTIGAASEQISPSENSN